MARIFLAIDLPKDLIKAVEKEQLKWMETGAGVKWVSPNQIHLTLKFIGEIAEARLKQLIEATEQICKQIQSFPLSLEGTGAFPSPKRPKVFWLGVAGDLDMLHSLQESIESGLEKVGFPRENRKFSPHITIARTKREKRLTELLRQMVASQLPSTNFDVKEVVIYQSILGPEGPKYIPLARCPLATFIAETPK